MSREAIRKILEEGDCFVLTTHVGADGDGFGSQLALARFLKAMAKTVHIINPDRFDSSLAFLVRDSDPVETYDAGSHDELIRSASAVLLLDVNTWSRVGDMADAVRRAVVKKACIDHHLLGSETFDVVWVREQACATGAMVFDLLSSGGWELTEDQAEPLYVSLLTDTGSFRFSKTSPEVHRMAARLLELGVKPNVVYENLYEGRTLNTVLFTAEILTTTQTCCEGRIAWQRLTRDMLDKHGAAMDDSGDVVNATISLAGVEVGILFKELSAGKTKASLRSKGRLDVNSFARAFDGGGHQHAAGIVLEEDFEPACRRILDAVCAALEELDGDASTT